MPVQTSLHERVTDTCRWQNNRQSLLSVVDVKREVFLLLEAVFETNCCEVGTTRTETQGADGLAILCNCARAEEVLKVPERDD